MEYTDVKKPLISENINPQLHSFFIKNRSSSREFKVLEPVMVHYQNFLEHGRKVPEHTLLPQELTPYLEKDNYPLPIEEDREMYHPNEHFLWWRSGFLSFLQIREISKQYGFHLTEETTYAEMGCASGRVLRHLCIQEDKAINVIGCDINVRHIEWMRNFLPKQIKIFQNSTLPILPLAMESVDIFCAFSVFTHIDDFEFTWLMEISRVLKPGGLFFCTLLTNRFWDNLGEHWLEYFAKKYPKSSPYPSSRELFLHPMPEERITFFCPETHAYNTDVWHHENYIQEEWTRFFNILSIGPHAPDNQTLVVLQKRE